jgi:hypothetical protein
MLDHNRVSSWGSCHGHRGCKAQMRYGKSTASVWVVTFLIALATVLTACETTSDPGPPSGAMPPSPSGEPTSDEQPTSDETSGATGSGGSSPTPPAGGGEPSFTPTAPVVTSTHSSAASLSALRRLVDQKCLRGTLAYRPPSFMTVHKEADVVVRVGRSDTAENPASGLPGSGAPVIEHPAVCDRMVAYLDGAGFSVRRIGERTGTRQLAPGLIAEWSWVVTPEASGTRVLQLDLFVLGRTAGGPNILVRTYREEIDVKVNRPDELKGFVRDWMAPLGLTVPVLAGAAIWLIRRRRSKVEQPPRKDHGDPAEQAKTITIPEARTAHAGSIRRRLDRH